MSEQNGATGIGTPTAVGIEVTPLPAPAVQATPGDVIDRHNPATTSAEDARATLKGLNAHPAVMKALQTPSDPAHRATLDWYRSMQKTAYGVPDGSTVDPESGATIAAQSETLTFAALESPDDYLPIVAPSSAEEAHDGLMKAAAGSLHALGIDSHTAKQMAFVVNSESARPLSPQRLLESAQSARRELADLWGSAEAAQAELAAIDAWAKEQLGKNWPVVQAFCRHTTLGHSAHFAKQMREAMKRQKGI